MKKILLLILSLSVYKIEAQQSYSYSESGFQQLEEIFGGPQYRKSDILEGLPANINKLEENKIKAIIYNRKNKNSYKYNSIKRWLKDTLKEISPQQFNSIMYAYLKYQNVNISFTSENSYLWLFENKNFIKKSFNKNNPPQNYKVQFNKDGEAIDISKQYQQIVYAGDASQYKPIFKLDNKPIKTINIKIDSNDKIYSIGDIHGNYGNLLSNLNYLAKQHILSYKTLKLKVNNYLIFTGDYADRGNHGIKTIFMVLLLKLFNPNQVFLLKGNHEDIDFVTSLPTNKNSIAIEIASRFLSRETDQISTILLNSLDLVYSILPHFLIAKNESNQEKSLLICHGDNQNNWNDIYPSKMFYDQKISKTSSLRGENIIIRNAKYVEKELREKGISIMIKGHDHMMPKKITFGKLNLDDPIINYILPYRIDLESLKKQSPGAINIDTKEFPIIVNISGSMQGINYYPTMVKVNTDNDFVCGWKYEIINSNR